MQPCAPDDTTISFFRQFHSTVITNNITNRFVRQFHGDNRQYQQQFRPPTPRRQPSITPTASSANSTETTVNISNSFVRQFHGDNRQYHQQFLPRNPTSIPQNHRTAFTTALCNTRPLTTCAQAFLRITKLSSQQFSATHDLTRRVPKPD